MSRFMVGATEGGRKFQIPGTTTFVHIKPLSPQRELEIRDKCTTFERRGGQQVERLDQVKQMRLLAADVIVDWGQLRVDDDGTVVQPLDPTDDRTMDFPDGKRPATLENKAEAMLRSSAFLNFTLDKARELNGEEWSRTEAEGEI